MNTHVEVQNASDDPDAPDPESCKRWVIKTLASLPADKQAYEKELTLRFVDETEGRALNSQYRNKNKATNVLSFPYESPLGVEPGLLGDIVICAPVVRREAREQNKSLQAHWAHLVVHGVLHLCGFEHEDNTEAEKMENLEIQLMTALGYANPYERQVV